MSINHPEDLSLHNDPRINQANGPWFTHEYINYFSIIPHSWLIEKEPIKVLPKPEYNDWLIGPKHKVIYKENAVGVRSLDPDYSHEISKRNADYSEEVPENASIEPWKVLIYYSTIPDLNLDLDLQLHKLQSFTGGSHGYRHMQYRLFLLKVGETDKCLKYYYQTAIRAWNEGNIYWGYRFLSYATHYLADLGHPFHVKVAPHLELLKFLITGRPFKEILTAAHNGHEVYVQYRFRHSFKPFKEALIRGSSDGAATYKKLSKNGKDIVKTPEKALKKSMLIRQIGSYRRKSTKLLNPLYKTLIDNFGKGLIRCYDINSLTPEQKKLDYSVQLMLLEHNVQELLFADPSHPALDKLDKLTGEALYNVGFMLGFLYEELKPFMP